MLYTLNNEYYDLMRKASSEGFDSAVIRFARRLIRAERLIKEFVTSYGESAVLGFDLNRHTITLGFKGTTRNLSIRPIEIHPTLLRELTKRVPASSEIERIINQRIEQIDRILNAREEEKLISPHEASKMLGCSYKTLWRWWKQGKIRAVRLPSGRLRYFKDEIEHILQK